jgi:hypothetical protein
MMIAKHDGTEAFHASGEVRGVYIPVPSGVVFIPGEGVHPVCIHDVQLEYNLTDKNARTDIKLLESPDAIADRVERQAREAGLHQAMDLVRAGMQPI